jgi:hypothetical protein
MVTARSLKVTTYTTVAALFMATFGCKPKGETGEESAAKTLDNFARNPAAGQPLRQNTCGPAAGTSKKLLLVDEESIILPKAEGLWADQKVRDQLKIEVYGVLSQVPPSLLAIFFQMGGKIDLSRVPNEQSAETVNQICQQALDPNSTHFVDNDLLTSCWRVDLNSGAVTIFVDPVSNGENSFTGVHHSLVRSFGYFLSQVMFKYDIEREAAKSDTKALGTAASNGAKKFVLIPKESPAPNDQVFLKNLADSVWKDVYGTSTADGITKLEEMVEYLKAHPDHKYDLSPYQSAYFSDKAEERVQFEYYAFAEAFDSYYCSEDTVKLMASDFPESYCQLKWLDTQLNPKLAHGVSSSHDPEEFALLESISGPKIKSYATCEWEKSDEKQEAQAKSKSPALALGNFDGVGGNVVYVQPRGRYYGGYTAQGSYGAGLGYSQCSVGCGSGGFLSSIFNGVGTIVGGVVKGAATIAGGAINLAVSPLKALFGGASCGVRPYADGGVTYYNGYGQVGVYAPGGYYAGGGIYGGIGIDAGFGFGGATYGRPYPPMIPSGGWNSQYPMPCFPQQIQFAQTSPYQTQYYNNMYPGYDSGYGWQGGQTYQKGYGGKFYFAPQPQVLNPGQYQQLPQWNPSNAYCQQIAGGNQYGAYVVPGYQANYSLPGYQANYGVPSYQANVAVGGCPNLPWNQAIPGQPGYCAPYSQYQGYPMKDGLPVKGSVGLADASVANSSWNGTGTDPYGTGMSNNSTSSTWSSNSGTSSYSSSSYGSSGNSYSSDSSNNSYSSGSYSSSSSQQPQKKVKKSSGGLDGCGTTGSANAGPLAVFWLLCAGALLPPAILRRAGKYSRSVN